MSYTLLDDEADVTGMYGIIQEELFPLEQHFSWNSV